MTTKPPADRIRTVFFISDRTGITAETLGHSLLTQFNGIEFQRHALPFVDTREKAVEVVNRINEVTHRTGQRTLVFSTLVDDEIREIIAAADCVRLDFFDAFIGPLERELDMRSSHAAGRAHGAHDVEKYTRRINAMNFALSSDDGVNPERYHDAEVVLIGVSRTGKTPTCLYLALHYGILAANFPLTPTDLEQGRLPEVLEKHRQILFGLTIEPERLRGIRQERRPDSDYASSPQVHYEVKEAEGIFRKHRLPYVDTTRRSVEEIATTLLQQTGLQRRLL
jgi:regulator of PEP synthase PpsR (kinase-PPPase family)